MNDRKDPALQLSLEIVGERRLPGREIFALLQGVRRQGTIRAAANDAGLSYRHAWGLLQAAEETLGTRLLRRQAGGRSGGSTSLSPDGERLLQRFSQLQRELSLDWRESEEVRPGPPAGSLEPETERPLLLASTMEMVETGLLDALEQAFHRASGRVMRHLGLGSGRALQAARQGRVDLVLSHAPDLEDQFAREGGAWFRVPLLANDLVLVGPASDPAAAGSVSGEEGATEALRRIARGEHLFLTRRDGSGTYRRELALWKKAGVTPDQRWYRAVPGLRGNTGILELATARSAYALVDRASFILHRTRPGLRLLVSTDQGNARARELENVYSFLAVNPDLVPYPHTAGVREFQRWLDREARPLVSSFGRERHGQALFSLPPPPAG